MEAGLLTHDFDPSTNQVVASKQRGSRGKPGLSLSLFFFSEATAVQPHADADGKYAACHDET